MAQLRQTKNQFEELGAQFLLVGMGSVEETAAFRRKLDISFPMISDPDRELYTIYQIGFMSMASIFTPNVVLRTATALAKGYGIGFPYGDVRQLSAVFVIETNGTISYCHYAKDSADHPTPKQILEFLSP